MRRRRALLGAALLLAAGPATGCEVTVSRADLERQVAEQIGEATGQVVRDVECPGDLRADEGLTMDCTVTTAKETMQVSVSVTAVDGAEIHYEIAEQPSH